MSEKSEIKGLIAAIDKILVGKHQNLPLWKQGAALSEQQALFREIRPYLMTLRNAEIELLSSSSSDPTTETQTSSDSQQTDLTSATATPTLFADNPSSPETPLAETPCVPTEIAESTHITSDSDLSGSNLSQDVIAGLTPHLKALEEQLQHLRLEVRTLTPKRQDLSELRKRFHPPSQPFVRVDPKSGEDSNLFGPETLEAAEYSLTPIEIKDGCVTLPIEPVEPGQLEPVKSPPHISLRELQLDRSVPDGKVSEMAQILETLSEPSIDQSASEFTDESLPASTSIPAIASFSEIDAGERPETTLTTGPWFLGLAMGETGLSAALWSASADESFPLFQPEDAWSHPFCQPLESAIASEKIYQFLPALDWAIAIPTEESIRLANLIESLVAALEDLFRCEAVGLGKIEGQLQSLAGVVWSAPSHLSDNYRFNLREATLKAGLVHQADQIFFLEPTIAQCLAPQSAAPTGLTTALYWGSDHFEILIAKNLADLSKIQRDHLTVVSLPYGTRQFKQDIFTRLVAPQLADLNAPALPPLSFGSANQVTTAWPWLKSSLFHRDFQGLCDRQTLTSHQKTWRGIYQEQVWQINVSDIETQILNPFWQKIQSLLSAQLPFPSSLQSLILCGDPLIRANTLLGQTIAKTFPAAKLDDRTQSCTASYEAQNLARLAQSPNLCDHRRHQYEDYFLLSELVQSLPAHSFELEELEQIQIRRGINYPAVQSRLVNLLTENRELNFFAVHGETSASLCKLETNQQYRTQQNVLDRLKAQFESLAMYSQQSWDDPKLMDSLYFEQDDPRI
ncbi:MAG: hypothetical protein AAGG02_06780 [Cyanobacteria bacterium P01_H01_bin.15]